MGTISYLTLYIFSIFLTAKAQDSFHIENSKKDFKLSFELVNNLVVIPLEINGVELSFLLDSGVNSTILFSLGEKDSVNLKNTESIFLRGLGGGEPVKALKSTNNDVRIGEAVNQNLTLYMVFDNPIALSNRMGIPIHGIIGNDFLKDFVVEFDYPRSRLRAYDPNSFSFKNCRKCEDLDLSFYRNKPYVKVTGEFKKIILPLNLLIDSGSGDALWIFSNEENGISLPQEFFPDFLGYGMGGSVYGMRTRIKGLNIGKYKLQGITASFPDSVYYKGIELSESRNGSLGPQILRRFKVTFDYQNKKLRLKPNSSFDEKFEYDMSGVVIAHEGFTLIKDIIRNPLPLRGSDENNTTAGNLVFKSTYDTHFELKPQYKIVEVRPDSPAERAGLKQGDLVLKINGRNAYNYNLSQITGLLSSLDGKRIKFVVERNGREKKISFLLERVL